MKDEKWFRKMGKCPYCGRQQAFDFHIDLPKDGFNECKFCRGWFVFGFEDGVFMTRTMTEQELSAYYAIIFSIAESNPNLYRIRG